MKPENVSNAAVTQEEYNVSKYYDEVDRTKYTMERKRQLSMLLGSSGGYTAGGSAEGSAESTSDTKSTLLNSNSSSNNSSKECGITILNSDDSNSENGGTDSGIFDYPDVASGSHSSDGACASFSIEGHRNSLGLPTVQYKGTKNSAHNPYAPTQVQTRAYIHEPSKSSDTKSASAPSRPSSKTKLIPKTQSTNDVIEEAEDPLLKMDKNSENLNHTKIKLHSSDSHNDKDDFRDTELSVLINPFFDQTGNPDDSLVDQSSSSDLLASSKCL